MTNQEVFDKVATHLLTDLRMSLRGNGDCVYRGLNGTMCAVGALIPDEMYRLEMDGVKDGETYTLSKSCHQLIQEYPDIRELFRGVNLDLLRSLQGAHDDSREFNEDDVRATYRRDRLRIIALAHQLDETVLNQLAEKLQTAVDK